MSVFMILPIIIPLLMGLTTSLFKNEKNKNITILISTILTFVMNIVCCFLVGEKLHVVKLASFLSVDYKVDSLGLFFAVLISFAWIMITIFNFEYIKHEQNHNRFYLFFLLTLSTLMSLCYSSNLITMYLSFEMITLFSMPLVLHSLTKESIRAALKYLFYSIGGAFLALFGLFFIVNYTQNAEFTSWNDNSLFASFSGNKTLYQIAVLSTIIGFSAKGGMFPLHGWLPTAHPVAPSPASAALSGVITKAGVICIIRVIYYTVGTNFIANSFVQYTLLALAVFTVFMGSLLAYFEKVFKKRLAYSTVSQISYILTGLFLFNQIGFLGALLHVVAHMMIKTCLFLFAGEVIYKKGYHNVSDLKGIGKVFPITTWCYTIASLGLTGIPLTAGFISKWYLANGAISSSVTVFNYLVPAILLVSAILTAMYLLPISIQGFLVKEDGSIYNREKEDIKMVVPMLIFAFLIVLVGVYPQPLIKLINVMIMGLAQ